MKSDKVSVIVPIYKVEKYLDKCVESIVNQTYDNLEILLIDDGSPDNCPKMCDEWAKKDKRIKVFHKKNGGLSDARNFGLKCACGDYIYFIDSDDYINEEMIATLYNDLIETHSDMSCVNYLKVTEDDENIKVDLTPKREILSPLEAHQLSFSTTKFGNYAWNKLYKKELFNNIQFPVSKKMEDLAIMYLLIDECKQICFNDIPLYFYVQRAGSILSNPNSSLMFDKMEFTIQKYDFLKKKYDFIYENELVTLASALDCYPYLDGVLKLKCDDLIKNISVNKMIVKNLNKNRKIKLFIYKINSKLFTKMFKKI